jgi:hypothetical protein
MSFSVYNKDINLQYSGSLSGVFAQKRNLLSPKFWRLLLDLNKFFKFALKDYKNLTNSKESIKEYNKKSKTKNTKSGFTKSKRATRKCDNCGKIDENAAIQLLNPASGAGLTFGIWTITHILHVQ